MPGSGSGWWRTPAPGWTTRATPVRCTSCASTARSWTWSPWPTSSARPPLPSADHARPQVSRQGDPARGQLPGGAAGRWLVRRNAPRERAIQRGVGTPGPSRADLARPPAPDAERDSPVWVRANRAHPGPGRVHAVLQDRQTAATSQVDAEYVIAADGAHSRAREQLGIPMDGPAHLADYERVEFLASLAGAVGDRRYALYVITRPDAAGVLAQRGRGDRWGISRERTAGQPRFADLGEQELTGLIARAVGVGDLRARIERLGSFPFAAQIAERYRERRGFLAGDAAHRMTPRGGTGMNTAIQDSFDLGWKLAWVLRGWAPRDLLDTYETERRPIGLHNVNRAAQPAGSRASAAEALPWDLNGRLAHRWVRGHDRPISTLDLVGEG